MESEHTGRLLEEPPSSKKLTWEIYDYYTLSEYSDYVLRSPVFSFAGSSWSITMYLDKYPNSDIVLCLNRTDASPLTQLVHCELGMHVNDKLFGGIASLPSETSDRGCYVDVFPRCELQNKRDVIAPEGILQVICKLQVDKKCVAVASSQTESSLMRSNTLSQDMAKLVNSADNSDVTIRVRGKDFRAHRCILSARTPVFASMFRVDMSEKSSGVVTIDDCEADCFGDFLNFIYTGHQQSLSPQRAISLYTLADKYDVTELKSDCLESLKKNLSKEALFDIVLMALRHSERELLQLTARFFGQHLKEIIKTVGWQNFLAENPTVANELLNRAIGDEDEETARC